MMRAVLISSSSVHHLMLAELVEEGGVEEEVVVEEEEEDEEEVVDDVDEDEEDALELEDVDDLNFFWETSSAVGNAASPIPNAPQSTAMICIVLPKPIWSARMQPVLELTC